MLHAQELQAYRKKSIREEKKIQFSASVRAFLKKLFVILHLPVDSLLYNEDVSKQKNK
jgi:hypothetical protein